MLESRKSKNYSENRVVSIIGPGTVVNGEIQSQGTIRIEGAVSGRVSSQDTIVIQESGKVKADLLAGQVIISGAVEGDVTAQERLEIASQARVVGNITAPRISIADGVLFEGRCTMKPPGQIQAPQTGGGQPGKGGGKAPEKAPDKARQQQQQQQQQMLEPEAKPADAAPAPEPPKA